MASRIMHLAAAYQLTAELPAEMDIPRFLCGSIMADSAPQERQASHFLTQVGSMKTYDISAFRDRYGHLLLTDGLVLGYYLHLLQDLVFRRFMYSELGFNPRHPGYLQGLHSDYRRLNQLLIRRYGLKSDMVILANAYPMDDLAHFDLAALSGQLADDFGCPGEKDAFFFTEEHAVCYIEKAVATCRRELRALYNDMPLTDPLNWMWARDPV